MRPLAFVLLAIPYASALLAVEPVGQDTADTHTSSVPGLLAVLEKIKAGIRRFLTASFTINFTMGDLLYLVLVIGIVALCFSTRKALKYHCSITFNYLRSITFSVSFWNRPDSNIDVAGEEEDNGGGETTSGIALQSLGGDLESQIAASATTLQPQ